MNSQFNFTGKIYVLLSNINSAVYFHKILNLKHLDCFPDR